MNTDSKKFLYKLLTTPSPVGCEEAIQKVVKARMQKYAKTIETDYHGNLIVATNTKATRSIMLAGHCDQIGFMVRHIDEYGCLFVDPLGGLDPVVLPGTHVIIKGKKGTVEGVFGKKAIHLEKPEERNKPQVDFDKLWVDIGAKNKKEAESLIEIGDSGTFKLGVTEFRNDIIVGPGLDNKVGVFVAMEALRLCANKKLDVALYSVSTVQEEIGLRGAQTAAYGINPDVGIAIDVTHAFDNPAKASKKPPPCDLGKGPAIARGPNTNPIVEKMLFAAAKQAKIKVQPEPLARLQGNDSYVIQTTRAGVATGSIGIPNRYMHTQVEMINLKDLENAAKLLAVFIQNITSKTDFRPR
ncbi:MAG: M42 family metallopeptidase [Bdellovibrionales bacterium]|nr:M42 family metallopeptidase [Bdellovibrionales bacterium]